MSNGGINKWEDFGKCNFKKKLEEEKQRQEVMEAGETPIGLQLFSPGGTASKLKAVACLLVELQLFADNVSLDSR